MQNQAGDAPQQSGVSVNPAIPSDEVGAATLDMFRENARYTEFLLDRLLAFSPAPLRGRVLEIGCGIGNLTQILLSRAEVTHLHAIDVDPSYVKETLRRVRDPRLEATVAAAEAFCPEGFTTADGGFDLVVSTNVLEHVEDHLQAFLNVRQMLRPGGVALLLVPAHQFLFSNLDRNLSHFRRYSRGDFQRLAPSAGLRVVRARYFNPLGAFGWWFNGKVLRRSVLPALQLSLYSRFAVPLSRVLDGVNPFPFGVSLLAVLARENDH